MQILTFDLEVENHTLNKRLASPFDPRNYIVEAGWSWNGGKPQSIRRDVWHRDDIMKDQWDKLQSGDLVVGFNIKFDLLWVWNSPSLQAALKRGVIIYCGQYTEYLLGGQTQDVQMCAMNDLAEKYGGGCKVDAVKEMWEAGYLTSQIPADLLHVYLVGGDGIVGDVMNTWLIFKGQVARFKDYHKDFKTMLKFRMDGLLATTEMEYNGVHCDVAIGEELRNDIVNELQKATEHLESFIPKLPDGLQFKWTSNTHKSCLIFGGVLKYPKWTAHKDENGSPIYAKKDEKWPLFRGVPVDPSQCRLAGAFYVLEVPEGQGSFVYKEKHFLMQDTYKGGKQAGDAKFKVMKVPDTTKPKGALKDYYFKLDGYTKPNPKWESANTDAYGQPLYSTAADVIDELATRGLGFTTALASKVGLEKDLGTYYWKEVKGKRTGMLTLVDESGIIHHKLNHTSTVTGRLSSSDPNLQNVPRSGTSKVKKMFSSRFEDGNMYEIDYSQLEVVVQGVLTQDEQLRKDLNNKIDFHCKRLAFKLNGVYEHVWDMCHVVEDGTYKGMRTDVKKFSFQRAYGAGAHTISQDTGMLRSDVDALIEAENIMYPAIKLFDQRLEAEIAANRIPINEKLFINGVAFTRGEGHWDSPTGTRYVWREDITPEFMHKHGKYTGFSPTERKNYPVQGFGGEIVQTMLGRVFRYMLANDRFNNEMLMVNTVHDCLWLDGKHKESIRIAKEVQGILESVPELFNKHYSELNIDVPFPCETEFGKDLFTMKTIH